MLNLARTNSAHKPQLNATLPRLQLDYASFGYLQKLTSHHPETIDKQSRFASRLALHLPDVAERIEESDFGMLHLEIGVLKLATRAAIARRDWDVVGQHFAFVAKMFADTGTELRDALHVSYLGMLFHGETSLNFAKACSLLPKILADALESVENHYDNLAS